MFNTYHYKKYMMPQKKVEFFYITFNNGSFISLSKNELISYDFKFYDELVWDTNEFVKKACSGQIKLRIKNHAHHIYKDSIVPFKKEYDRKEYYEQLCLDGHNIKSIRFFNENNWSETVLGNFSSSLKNDILTIVVHEDPHKHSSDSNEFFIRLFEPKIEDICKIHFVMENCESFTAYNSEIEEFKVEFSKELFGGEGLDFQRKASGGYIKIKLKKTLDPHNGSIFVFEDEEDQYQYADEAPTTAERIIKHFKMDPEKEHNIGELYITYYNQGFGKYLEESINIENIQDVDWDSLTEDEYYEIYNFVGGHTKVIGKDTLIIYFE